MASRNFSTEVPVNPATVGGRSYGEETVDLRNDVETAFEATDLEIDAVVATAGSADAHATGDGSDHADVAANTLELAKFQSFRIPAAGPSPLVVPVLLPVAYPDPLYSATMTFEDLNGAAQDVIVNIQDVPPRDGTGFSAILTSASGAPIDGQINVNTKKD